MGDVMVSVLASSSLDRGFQLQSGQTKDYKYGTSICCFSGRHAIGGRAKVNCLGISIMCPSGATCWSVVFFGYSNETDRHDITEILLKVTLNPISHHTHKPFPINSDLLNIRPYMMKLLILVPEQCHAALK